MAHTSLGRRSTFRFEYQEIERPHAGSSSRREGCDMRQIKPRAAPQNQVVQATELGDALFMTRTIATLFAFAATAITLQTSPAFAFSSEAQQMCSGDAMRLCSSE